MASSDNSKEKEMTEKSTDMDSTESATEKKSRMRSIRLVNVAVCILLIGFTIVSPGLYPYMKQVSTEFSVKATSI